MDSSATPPVPAPAPTEAPAAPAESNVPVPAPAETAEEVASKTQQPQANQLPPEEFLSTNAPKQPADPTKIAITITVFIFMALAGLAVMAYLTSAK